MDGLSAFHQKAQQREASSQAREILLRGEAAELARVSLPTFDCWLRQPGFPAFRAGRKWLVPREPYLEWLRQQAEKQGG